LAEGYIIKSVADAHVLMIGGINIANKYENPGKEPWLDYAGSDR
jgi:hypothetical protein